MQLWLPCFIVSFDSFCHNERITAHEVTNLGNVFTVLLVRQLEVTQLLSEKIPSDRMRPCKCSLPCCFSWRWCHRLERAGGREGGRFGEDGGGCFWQIASLSRSDRHFQPLSRLFSSLFATSRLSLMPACCEGAAVQKVRSRGVKGTKQKSKATPPPPLSLGRWMKPMRKHTPFFFFFLFKHTPQIFALDDAFPLRPACVRRFDLATSTWTSTCWNTLTNIFLFRVVDCG